MSLEKRRRETPSEDRRASSRFEDDRFAGKTVNKVRQEQYRERVINSIIKNAEAKRSMGMPLSPEEQWVLNNRSLFQ